MRKLLIINPNSSPKMTYDIKMTLKEQSGLDIINMPKAPEVLESFTDYTLAGTEVIHYIKNNDLSSYSGILLACFGDPCLYALKELCNIPVIGIAEASFSRALLLGNKFSVVAASAKAKPMMESLIDMYGLQMRNAGTVTLATDIRAFLNDKEILYEKLMFAMRQTKEIRAETVILGCAGMTAVDKHKLSAESGQIIIDPIINGVSALKAIIDDGNLVSKSGLYA
ncbi:aspartate/glutamate racemase family protein [Pectinatus frisingensis]|jgi:allantoin racemase|uniref:aspartate/glutamate racemase family protein n=1 Tax=Pectinatus frisingensis TaxID=865 RepID=UPI0018C59243|nr:aspartate/glutamate racemase family protein [Pectinatus frisingensis]